MSSIDHDTTKLEIILASCGALLGLILGAMFGWSVLAPVVAKQVSPSLEELGDAAFQRVVLKQQKPGVLDSEDGRKMIADWPEHRKQTALGAVQGVCAPVAGFFGCVVFFWIGTFIARFVEGREERRQMRDLERQKRRKSPQGD